MLLSQSYFFILLFNMKFKLETCDIYIAEKKILENVSLSIKEGTFLRIKGKNGAGKTVLLNTLLGINKQVEGQIAIAYQKTQICYITDTPFFFDDEKVSEVLLTLAFFYKQKDALFEQYCQQIDLDIATIKHKKIHELSKGMKKN